MWRQFYVIWLGANERECRGINVAAAAAAAGRQRSAVWSANIVTFHGSAKPQPEESISMLRTPKRSAKKKKNYPAEPNSPSVGLCSWDTEM